MPQNLFGRPFQYALVGLIAVDLVSLATAFSASAMSIALVVLAVATFVLAIVRFDLAMLVLIAELVAGAQGRLLSMDVANFSVSLRFVLFLVIFAVFIGRLLVRHTKTLRIQRSPTNWLFLALLAVVGWGMVNGFFRSRELSNLFFDANGFLYLALVFPIFEFLRSRERLQAVLQVVAAGVVFLAAKTLLLLALFSHQYESIPSIYRWVRDARMFEITYYTENFYRIFSQGQVMSVAAFFLFGSIAVFRAKDQVQRQAIVVAFLGLVTVIASFSRSFWIAIAATVVVMLIPLVRRFHFSLKRLMRIAGATVLMAVLAGVLLSFTANYPYLLGRPGTQSAFSLLEERSSDVTDVAAQSRYQLLGPLVRESIQHPLLGSGFGTTVTFTTADPRAIASGTAERTTFAFEWGYLDVWLKVGLVGVIILLALVLSVLRRLWRTAQRVTDPSDRGLLVGLTLALTSIALIHAISPYLNHPLGLGLLMLAGAIGFYFDESETTTLAA